MDKRGYSENGEWELVDAPGFKHNIVYSSCCGNTYYTDVTFQFVLIRKPLFYTVNLIIPCVLISFLTVLVFYLPSGKIIKKPFSIYKMMEKILKTQ